MSSFLLATSRPVLNSPTRDRLYDSSDSSSSSSNSPPTTLEKTVKYSVDSGFAPLHNPEEWIHLNCIANNSISTVCQIVTSNPNDRGSGFIIGPCTLMTAQHVLKTQADAEASKAYFFKVTEQDATTNTTKFEIVGINFDTTMGYYSGKELDLDFAIVYLQKHPYLEEVARHISRFGILQKIRKDETICVVQYPEIIDHNINVRSDLKYSFGPVFRVDESKGEILYQARTSGGSSGGAVLNRLGQVIAIHLGGHHEKAHREYAYGLLITKVVSTMKRQWGMLNELFHLEGRHHPSQRSAFVFRRPLAIRIDRMDMVERVHCLLNDTLQKMIVIYGPHRSGKTEFVRNYAQIYQQEEYFVIYELDTRSRYGLEISLQKAKFPGENLEQRLQSLSSAISESEEKTLLLFDGTNDYEAYRMIQPLLAAIENAERVHVLFTSIMNALPNVYSQELICLDDEKASAFLLSLAKSRGAEGMGKTIRKADALNFVKTLDCMPGEIVAHFEAFLTRSLRIEAYIEALNNPSHRARLNLSIGQLLGIDTDEALWEQAMESVQNDSDYKIAQYILKALYLFDRSVIPKDLFNDVVCNKEITKYDSLDIELFGLPPLQRTRLIDTVQGGFKCTYPFLARKKLILTDLEKTVFVTHGVRVLHKHVLSKIDPRAIGLTSSTFTSESAISSARGSSSSGLLDDVKPIADPSIGLLMPHVESVVEEALEIQGFAENIKAHELVFHSVEYGLAEKNPMKINFLKRLIGLNLELCGQREEDLAKVREQQQMLEGFGSLSIAATGSL